MQMKAYMKRTGSYMATTRLTVTVICLLLLLVVSPLYGRRYDMAIVPDSNVNLAGNIRDVLNSAGGNVTNEVITFFQTRANINEWAKYKPVRYRKNFDLTDGEFQYAHYGINVPVVDRLNFGKNRVWEYLMPPGGEASPLRLSDFKGYYTDAVIPLAVSFPDEVYIGIQTNEVYVKIDSAVGNLYRPDYNVLLSELFYNELEWFIGVGINNMSRSGFVWQTTSKPLKSWEFDDYVTMPIPSLWEAGDKIAVSALLCQYSFTGELSNQPDFPRSYYLCPDSNIGYKEFILKYKDSITGVITLVKSDVSVDFIERSGVDDIYGYEYSYIIDSIRYSPKNESGNSISVKFEVQVDDRNASGYDFDFTSTQKVINGNSQTTIVAYPNQSGGIGVGNEYTDYVYVTVYATGSGDSRRQMIFSEEFNLRTGTWA